MAKSRQDKITNYEEQIAQLNNRKKQEIQKMKQDERKARTKRLCSRQGLLEKYMPDLIIITDEQFEMFIKRGINTDYGRKILGEIIMKNATATKPATAEPQKPDGNSDSVTQSQAVARSGA